MGRPTLQFTLEPARTDDPAAPLIVLGPSLGTTVELWAEAVAPLAEEHRVLRYDLPGHAFSPTASEPFSVAEIADSVVDLVESVGGGPFHYAGVSFGGTVGLELALRSPSPLLSLAVLCSGAQVGTPEAWLARARQVRASGTSALAQGSAERWFAPGFLERSPTAGSSALNALLEVDDESYALACRALAEFDVTPDLGTIRIPTLCISGEHDQVTPVAQLAELARRIPDAEHATVRGAAHLPTLERPLEVTELLLQHLATSQASQSQNEDISHG